MGEVSWLSNCSNADRVPLILWLLGLHRRLNHSFELSPNAFDVAQPWGATHVCRLFLILH